MDVPVDCLYQSVSVVVCLVVCLFVCIVLFRTFLVIFSPSHAPGALLQEYRQVLSEHSQVHLVRVPYCSEFRASELCFYNTIVIMTMYNRVN